MPYPQLIQKWNTITDKTKMSSAYRNYFIKTPMSKIEQNFQTLPLIFEQISEFKFEFEIQIRTAVDRERDETKPERNMRMIGYF